MAAIAAILSSIPSSSSSSKFSKYQSHPSAPPPCRVVCRGGSQPPPPVTTDFQFALHDALDSSGINTTHAREARQNFMSQIKRLSSIEREISISINRRVDLAKTALYIAAEDDSLISHSSVALPVDAFIERLDDLSMGFCTNNSSALKSSPEMLLDSLEKFLYVKKVLTHRSGSAVMLALIYSEILKTLRLWSLLDFDCEIFFPHDNHGLPRGYHKQKSKESDHQHILTSLTLLEKILRNLKKAFWPFQHDHTKSLFLRAAHAADCVDISKTFEGSGAQLASAKAAQHRLDRGVWTSVHFGDMRRALSACERLILLESDPKELRDYSVLLYHCGFYEQSLQYLKLYQEKGSSLQKQASNKLSSLEEYAVEKLMIRLNLISMEEGWSKPSHASPSDPGYYSKATEPTRHGPPPPHRPPCNGKKPQQSVNEHSGAALENHCAQNDTLTTAKTWPPPPHPVTTTTTTFPPDHTNMLGLHNILFIAPPPSFHHHQPPHIPSTHQIANTNDQCNIANNQESWTTLNKYQQKSSFLKRGDLNVVGDNDTGRNIGPARACRDCGNRAKKECQYRRCRTCCKSREYDCTTHMKSTWVSAARRRERLGCGGGGDSSASSGGGCVGGKRPRENVTTTSNSFSTSNNNAAASVNFDTGSSYQDASFKLSLPGQVREPAVFRCIRVTAINSGEAEVAYQAKVNISGHVFKGILYDQGIDEKNLFPCVSKMQSGERTRDSTSPIVEPSVAYAATGNHRLLEGPLLHNQARVIVAMSPSSWVMDEIHCCVVWLQGRRCESTSSLKLYVLERDFLVFPSFSSEVKLLFLFLMPCSVRIFPLFNGGQRKFLEEHSSESSF
ncbi:hypothetical protein NC651_000360 [Populus alba x Populus x berolinensis]|nr:hypothetical protein NC651_000360 [Populus alba x Populus x berolinensis]